MSARDESNLRYETMTAWLATPTIKKAIIAVLACGGGVQVASRTILLTSASLWDGQDQARVQGLCGAFSIGYTNDTSNK